MSAWQKRRERVDRVAAELREMHPAELVEVLWREFDLRRLDAAGNPSRETGLYEAACEATAALLTGKANDAEMVERLAAVGRGARIQVKDQDTVSAIREIAPLVESLKDSKNIPEEQKADFLARTLTTRFRPKRPVKSAHMQLALRRNSAGARVAVVAIAAGILARKGGKDRRDTAVNRYDLTEPADIRQATDIVNKALQRRQKAQR